MLLSDTYIVRGICVDYPDGNKRVRVMTRNQQTNKRDSFVLPSHLPITKNNLIIYMTDKYGDQASDMLIQSIRDHIDRETINGRE